MIGDGDVEAILSNGDFDTTAVFTISTGPTVTLTVSGWFTQPSDETVIYGQAIEAVKPTFTVATSLIGTVRNKMSVVINSITYIVERVENNGNGVTVVWLKT